MGEWWEKMFKHVALGENVAINTIRDFWIMLINRASLILEANMVDKTNKISKKGL